MILEEYGFEFEVNNDKNTAVLQRSFKQKNFETIRIPQTIDTKYIVIGIADNVFKQNVITKSIEIPSTIQFIGENAFSYCSSLSTVTFYKSINTSNQEISVESSTKESHSDGIPKLNSIDDFSFFQCPKLMSINNIPSGIQRIGKSAFSNCDKLQFVSFASSSCIEIDEKAFCHCENLKFIVGDMKNLETIGNYAFYNCKNLISFLVDSDNVNSTVFRKIGHHSFNHCWTLRTIDPLLRRTKIIGIFSFSDCRNISLIAFPEESLLQEIPANSFSHCTSLKSVIRVPSKIGSFAFSDCHLITEISSANGKGFDEIDEGAFYNCVNLENTPHIKNE